MSDEDRGEPAFTIEHRVEIAAAPDAVWAVFADFGAYAEWNPYVLSIGGDMVEGAQPEITIAQENWPEPMTVQPTVISMRESQLLHWRGQVGDGGLFDTDHRFELRPAPEGGTLFVQSEEFRGSLTAGMDGAARGFTEAAFRAMNEALARRVLGRPS